MSSTTPFPPANPTAPYGPIDLLPEYASFQPRATLKVAFTPQSSTPAESNTAVELTHGEKLSWQQTQSSPSLYISEVKTEVDATYTILMTDPDAPTPNDTKYAYWRHWIQPGLRPSSTEAKSDKAPLTEYLAPGKKDPSADAHRYILLLYREPSPGHSYHSLSKADVGAENFEARRAFDAKGWVEKNGLKLVAVEWFWGTG